MIKKIRKFIKNLGKGLLFICAAILEIYNSILIRIHIGLFHQKMNVDRMLSKYDIEEPHKTKVLAVIAHIVAAEKVKDPQLAIKAAERLERTIDGLIYTFSHCDLQIIINTMKEKHVIEYLPEHQRNLIQVKERADCHPALIEFRAQDEFIQHIDEFEWFIFLEDDIILHDTCVLDKISSFKKNLRDERIVLMPNRYEMYKGVKTYLDLGNAQEKKYLYNRLSILKIGGWEFVRFLNPHAAFYCLSKDQLRLWIKSGRRWYDKVAAYGPIESSASGCLQECFILYKPHTTNLYFFEVQHAEAKYSIQDVDKT